MYEFKQLLVLALASTALACQCKKDGATDGILDVQATQFACTRAGGQIRNKGTKSVFCEKGCHDDFYTYCHHYGGYEWGFPKSGSTCPKDYAWCKTP